MTRPLFLDQKGIDESERLSLRHARMERNAERAVIYFFGAFCGFATAVGIYLSVH